MAKEKVIEYETVERQEEITVCDHCGKTEKNADAMIDVTINPTVEKREVKEIIPIQRFDDEAEMRKEYEKMRPMNFNLTSYGIGERKVSEIKNTQCSTKQDMCLSCIKEFFDIDIPDDEITDGVNFKNNDLVINTTKEVRSIWPNFIKIFNEDWANRDELVETGWFGKIILWPFVAFATIMEYDQSWANLERQKGYLAASIGSILWFSAAILAYLFIL